MPGLSLTTGPEGDIGTPTPTGDENDDIEIMEHGLGPHHTRMHWQTHPAGTGAQTRRTGIEPGAARNAGLAPGFHACLWVPARVSLFVRHEYTGRTFGVVQRAKHC